MRSVRIYMVFVVLIVLACKPKQTSFFNYQRALENVEDVESLVIMDVTLDSIPNLENFKNLKTLCLYPMIESKSKDSEGWTVYPPLSALPVNLSDNSVMALDPFILPSSTNNVAILNHNDTLFIDQWVNMNVGLKSINLDCHLCFLKDSSLLPSSWKMNVRDTTLLVESADSHHVAQDYFNFQLRDSYFTFESNAELKAFKRELKRLNIVK